MIYEGNEFFNGLSGGRLSTEDCLDSYGSIFSFDLAIDINIHTMI